MDNENLIRHMQQRNYIPDICGSDCDCEERLKKYVDARLKEK